MTIDTEALLCIAGRVVETLQSLNRNVEDKRQVSVVCKVSDESCDEFQMVLHSLGFVYNYCVSSHCGRYTNPFRLNSLADLVKVNFSAGVFLRFFPRISTNLSQPLGKCRLVLLQRFNTVLSLKLILSEFVCFILN